MDHYAAAAMESIKAMHDQVGDLCFTPDGIAKRGYGEINRHVNRDKISSVRSAAENFGLWRFVEGARHDGFNL